MSTKQFLRTAAVAIWAALVTVPVQADDYFRHGGIRYKIESFIDQELRVTFPEEADHETTDLVIPATIKTKQGQVWTVTAIGENAFNADLYEAGYKSLRSVTIPKTVKIIHKDAFKKSKVTMLTVNCAKPFPTEHLNKTLVTLNLGQLATFKEVGEDYFSTFKKIRTITVAPQNKNFAVEDGVLYNKAKTVLLCFPRGKRVLRMPATVQRFAIRIVSGKPWTDVFSGPSSDANTDITEIHFSPAFKEILPQTFSGCKNLERVTLPNTLTSIGSSAFSWTKLSSVVIPNSVTEIGNSAFWNCYSLKQITLPNAITKIAKTMFDHCYALERIVIPNSVAEIGDGAFMECKSLKEVVIGSGVKKIGECAFTKCQSLTAISLPNTLEIIGSRAFVDTGLKTIDIPASVKKIDCYALYCAGKGVVINCYPQNPPSNICASDCSIFNSSRISDPSNVTLHIPRGAKERYLRSAQYRLLEKVMIDDL